MGIFPSCGMRFGVLWKSFLTLMVGAMNQARSLCEGQGIMLRRHDHTIFLVPDPSELDSVADQFAAAGFLITERDDLGKETAATLQKLICFADGSYIEILTIRDEAARARHRRNAGLGRVFHVVRGQSIERRD